MTLDKLFHVSSRSQLEKWEYNNAYLKSLLFLTWNQAKKALSPCSYDCYSPLLNTSFTEAQPYATLKILISACLCI